MKGYIFGELGLKAIKSVLQVRLKEHRRNVHEGRRFECAECDYVAVRKYCIVSIFSHGTDILSLKEVLPQYTILMYIYVYATLKNSKEKFNVVFLYQR